MLSFAQCSWSEGLESLSAVTGRITLYRHLLKEGPLNTLLKLVDALNAGDVTLAVYCYHNLLGQLMNDDCRRVSGNLFTDYLLSQMLESESGFSRMAARGVMDAPVYEAMRVELRLFGVLSTLKCADLRRYISERHRELKLSPRQGKDGIALMSNAAWAGGSLRSAPKEKTEQTNYPTPTNIYESEWLTFDYDATALETEYVSDEALEEIYRRLLSSYMWDDYIDDIWNFFASYGTGKFIKHRLFSYFDSCLLPVKRLPVQDELTLHEEERVLMTENVISFMRGESTRHMLIVGDNGRGKTTQILSLTNELPAARLIITDAQGAYELFTTAADILDQPLKFIILLDDVDMTSEPFRRLRTLVTASAPTNALICATARSGDDGMFLMRIKLSAPDMSTFVALIKNLLLREGVTVSTERIQDVCLDQRLQTGEQLTYSNAQRVAALLTR